MKKNLKRPAKQSSNPVLRFTPTAWAKLLFLRDEGETEIGGFGITAADDLLLVQNVALVGQTASWADVEFEDQSVADFFDAQVDAGRQPQEFARIWIHTHPGNSAQPSQTDEQTFKRVFGRSDWAVMFILARGGQVFCRLRYNVGPGTDVNIPVDIDYSLPFGGSDARLWQLEYAAHVHIPAPDLDVATELADFGGRDAGKPPAHWYDDWYEYSNIDEKPKEVDHVRDY
jgi:hypothetical protein